MALSYEQFLRQLIESGLMSEDDVKAIINPLPEHERPKNGEQFARLLVKAKRLTAYQAQQIYGGKGKTLVMGNYEVLDKLGQGGMGLVLKAEHRRMKRKVALKILSPTVTKNADLTARFQREVEAAAKLKHENIVTAYDADESNGTRYLVMEYVEGSDLSSHIKKHGVLPIVQAVEYILQAARGLDYAHKQRVTHRDIKPANLLLDLTGCVKILDMGLARIEGEIGEQAELTSTGAVMGTVDYMAPEQALNTKDADARSDIYSLGITLWYLLTGQPAYEGTSLMARMLAHRDSPVPSLRATRPQVSAELDAVFRKMIAKKPADRYQTMAEVVTALAACLGGSGSSTASASASGPDDPSLMQFLTNLGNTNAPPQTKGISTLQTNAAVETTLIGAVPELSAAETPTLLSGDVSEITDPETMTGHALPSDKKQTVKARKVPSRKKSASVPSSQSNSGGSVNNRTKLMIGGAGFLALVILLGIIIRIKNKDGSITEIKPPEGATAEIVQEDPKSTTPTPPIEMSTQPVNAPAASMPDQWTSLFDGNDTTAWSTLGPFKVQDGLLVANGGGANAISKDEFDNFELEADWKIGPEGNGGIYYREAAIDKVAAGNEYQMLDDAAYSEKQPPIMQTGSIYGLIAPTSNASKPIGEWNKTRIVCNGTSVEHWLNDQEVVSYDTASESWKNLLNISGFAGKTSVGIRLKGHILLQGHTGEMAFRNIRIRPVTSE